MSCLIPETVNKFLARGTKFYVYEQGASDQPSVVACGAGLLGCFRGCQFRLSADDGLKYDCGIGAERLLCDSICPLSAPHAGNTETKLPAEYTHTTP